MTIAAALLSGPFFATVHAMLPSMEEECVVQCHDVMDIGLDAEDGVETDVAACALKGSVEVADITGIPDDDRPPAAWTDWAEDFAGPFLYIGFSGLFMACSKSSTKT
jgi:hypothetical protein